MMPARVKHRKMMRGNRKGIASRDNSIAFGSYALQSTGRCWLDTRTIEACRIAITRHMKRKGKLWIRVFPHKSFSKKPLEVRQGGGKGAVESWVAVVRPATILFELDGVTETTARDAMRLAANKLPIRTRFIKRH